MENQELRPKEDRRRQPTPMLSPYTLSGRRKGFSDQNGLPKEGYVDHYGPALLALLVLISGLNCLDCFFTMKILSHGGQELNPIVEPIIALLGEKFWVWKFAIISFSSVILCLHSQYKRVKIAILLLCFLYIGLIGYQLIGLTIYNL
jgi:hypothetical protein